MAVDYTAGGKTFRSAEIAGKQFPAVGLVDHPKSIITYGWDNDLAASQGLPNEAAATSSGATHALVTVEGSAGGVRYREDGTAAVAVPSSHATAGLFVPVGSAFVVVAPPGGDLSTVKLIETDTSVVVNVLYYKIDS